jgi:hypothetical protein
MYVRLVPLWSARAKFATQPFIDLLRGDEQPPVLLQVLSQFLFEAI